MFGIGGVVGGILLAAVFAWIKSKQARMQTEQAQMGAARIIEEAKKDAAAIKKEAELHAKDSVLKERAEFEKRSA